MSITRSIARPITRPLTRPLTAGGVGGGFSPRQLTGLTGWYDPSDIGSLWQLSDGTMAVTASGDFVGRISDKSGLGNHLIQATGTRRGVYTEASGLRYVDLDGTDDGYTCATGGGSSTAFFICAAVRFDSAAANQIIFDDRNGLTGIQVYFNAANTRMVCDARNGTSAVTAATSNGSISIGTNHIVTCWYDGSVVRLQVNSTTTAVSAAVTLAAGSATFGVGRTVAGANYLDGRLFGLVYLKDANPSAGEREKVKTFLAAKAGVFL